MPVLSVETHLYIMTMASEFRFAINVRLLSKISNPYLAKQKIARARKVDNSIEQIVLSNT